MQINYPQNLLLFTQDFLTNMKQSLIKVWNNIIIIKNLINLVYLDGSNLIHNYQLSGTVLTTNTMMVDFL